MSNFIWNTYVEVSDEEGGLLECLDFDFRMSRTEIAGYIESVFEPRDDEILSFSVGQQFQYACPLTGHEAAAYEDHIVPWSAVYAQLEDEGFVWSDEEEAWVAGYSDFS